jgi:histidine phosphotransferase ChpT
MIDTTKLSALVASRICHDLVEPMSAMIQGLEMLKSQDGAKPDPDAMSLLEHGVNKAWAKLEFFRFALAGSAAEGASSLNEGREVAHKLYSVLKPELAWQAPDLAMPRQAVRVVINLLLVANECLPRGGAVTVAGKPGEVRIEAAGARAKIREATAAALRGEESEELSGHTVLPTLTALLAQKCDVAVEIREGEEQVELLLRSAAFGA